MPIKVLGRFGPELAFVYANSWSPYNSVDHVQHYEGPDRCADLTSFTHRSADDQTPCYLIHSQKDPSQVTRVIGVFFQECNFC